jgi:hypothetical protein
MCFLLVCGVIWVYGRIIRADKKQDKSGYEKEQRLFKMYQNIEDMLAGFEEYAEEARAGLDERIRQAEALMANFKSAPEFEPPAESRPVAAPVAKSGKESAAESKEPKPGGRARENPKRRMEDLIPEYLAMGMEKEEVAKRWAFSSRRYP